VIFSLQPFGVFWKRDPEFSNVDYLHISKASQHVSFECDANKKKIQIFTV